MRAEAGGDGWWRPLRVAGHEPVYAVVMVVLRVLIALLFRLRVGGGTLPGGPVVVAANHVSYLDPITLGVALTRLRRRGRYLTTAVLFTMPVVGPVLHMGGFIPVRQGDGARALAAAVAALRAGEVVVIYPEGHVAGGRVLPARPGVVRLARATGAPVVPVAQVGMERGASRLAWLRRRAAAVVVGAPFHPSADLDEAAAAQEVLDRIRALVPAARAVATGDGWAGGVPGESGVHFGAGMHEGR